MDGNLIYRLATPDDAEPVYKVYWDVCWWLHNVRGVTDQWEGEPDPQYAGSALFERRLT
jgi:hypothetical protein